jgi:hypothetical protein
MVAWVVFNRQQPRQFVPFLAVRPSFPILEPSPLALSRSLDALCFKSVHQPFSNQPLPHSFLKMPECMGFVPCDMRFNVQTCELPACFRPISLLFTPLRTLLHSTKTQLLCSQTFRNSLRKTTRGGVPPGLAHSQGLLEPHGPHSRILELADGPALGRKHGGQMGGDTG